MNYNTLIKFAEENSYELHQYHKDIIEVICRNKGLIMPRQCGKDYILDIIKQYCIE